MIELVRFLKRAGTHVLKWRLSFYADGPLKIRKSKQGPCLSEPLGD